MPILNDFPTWYFIIAIIFSCYYAYRGYMGNWIAMVQRNETIAQGHRKFKNWEIISVFCIHDMLFHLICSLAGFFALVVAYDLYETLFSSENIDGAKSVMLAFSFLFGIVGVTGQLPPLIQLGKFPGMK